MLDAAAKRAETDAKFKAEQEAKEREAKEKAAAEKRAEQEADKAAKRACCSISPVHTLRAMMCKA